MVTGTGIKRIMADPRVWSRMDGETKAERIARANLGVWKSIEEVPSKYRIEQYAPAYRDRDLMQEFVDDYKPETSEGHYSRKYGRVKRALESYLGEGEMYAFMSPEQVNGFFETRRDTTIRDQYQEYLSVVRTLYDWLMMHSDYEHRYNPVDMAMLSGGSVADVVNEWCEHKEITEQ